jgi:DNA-binding NtrC family response regulator
VPVRIALIYEDRKFRDRLVAALRKEGHQVVVFEKPEKAKNLASDTSQTEIVISRIKGQFPAIQIMVTSVPMESKYTGGWSAVLAEPLTAEDIVKGLRSLLPVASK